MKPITFFLGFSLSLALAVSLLGCKKSQDTALERATGGKVRRDGDKVTITTKDGKATMESKGGTMVIKTDKGEETVIKGDGQTATFSGKDGTMTIGQNTPPKGFPLAIIKNSVIRQTMDSAKEGEDKSLHVTLTSASPFDDVVDFYEKELKDKGLKIQRNAMNMDDSRHTSLTGTSDKLEVMVMVMQKKSEDVTAMLNCKLKR